MIVLVVTVSSHCLLFTFTLATIVFLPTNCKSLNCFKDFCFCFNCKLFNCGCSKA